MQLYNEQYLYSASDLVHFLECRHLTFLDFKNVIEKNKTVNEDPLNKLLQERGNQHELDYLAMLRQEGLLIKEIPKDQSLHERVKLTEDAIRSGVDVVYQGVFYQHPWRGDADFLIKVNTQSDLGDFSYEVIDTKLSKNPDTKHIVQLCFYSDLLGSIQGFMPKTMHLVLGDNKRESFNTSEFIYYYERCKGRFIDFVTPPLSDVYPEPCNYCKFCDWKEDCQDKWETDKHLSLIANIQHSQINKLQKDGVETTDKLAGISEEHVVPELNRDVFKRLRSQAILQKYKSDTGNDKYEILPLEQGKGFSRLPNPDAGDIFFDIEGDPLYPEGLEYLFGVYYLDSQVQRFKAFWAHDHEEEFNMFKDFMGFVENHLNSFPNAHIYHYNHYEPTALKRLACKYSYAEEQLDNLLRNNKFVDLYKVVREAIRVSEPSYSLKNIEVFYSGKRNQSVSKATDSIVIYNQWREVHDSQLLQDLQDYNEKDCVSTMQLRDWLLSIRPDNIDDEGALRLFPARSTARKDWEIEYERYTKVLTDANSTVNFELRQHLLHLLEFHNREDKPEWWARFDRMDKFVDELIDDTECLAGLRLVEQKGYNTCVFSFPPQDYKLKEGKDIINVFDEGFKTIGKVIDINDEHSLISLELKNLRNIPEIFCINEFARFNTVNVRKAIYRVTDSILSQQAKYSAIVDILQKSIPRINGHCEGDAIIGEDSFYTDSYAALSKLDNSYIIIQGPPGSGKTFTSAKLILQLIKYGKKVGISSNSHKVIHNLLDEIEKQAQDIGFNFSGIKKSSSGREDSVYNGANISSDSSTELSLGYDLYAGTVFLFAYEYLDQHLDYLFIDEAGQVSVANVVAMGTSAKNIVLVGDQMQLGQPIQAVHPGESGLSILEFLLQGHATIPPDRGIFIDSTRRLRSEICSFTSNAFYDGRLQPHVDNDKRKLIFDNTMGEMRPEGIHIISVDHTGCSQKSIEEGEVIKDIYNKLLHQRFIDKDNQEKLLAINDILVVAPYNVQVNYLQSILPDAARVGTVDKFQGQEAPVVIFSMVTSNEKDLPRNIEFLYSKNRLNVAISRAQCLAVVVMNKNLLEIPCKSIEQMRLVNTFCYLDEYSENQFVI